MVESLSKISVEEEKTKQYLGLAKDCYKNELPSVLLGNNKSKAIACVDKIIRWMICACLGSNFAVCPCKQKDLQEELELYHLYKVFLVRKFYQYAKADSSGYGSVVIMTRERFVSVLSNYLDLICPTLDRNKTNPEYVFYVVVDMRQPRSHKSVIQVPSANHKEVHYKK